MDPVPLDRIAEAMRDNAWVDMRVVDLGLLARVRIQSVTVTPHNDTLELYQELPGDRYVHHEVDSEDVMYMGESTFEREDVPEPKEKLTSGGADPAEYDHPFMKYKLPSEARALFPLVRRAVFNEFAQDSDEMEREFWKVDPTARNPTNLYAFSIYVRYGLLLTLYEVSELPKMDVCYTVGYHSLQPMISALQFAESEAAGRKKDVRLLDVTRNACKSVKKFLGSSHTAPKRHDSVL